MMSRENRLIKDRLSALRKAMQENRIDYYLITSADCHGSEYVHEHFQARAYFSGFTGSAGTLLVAEGEAALWTDGRYFLQAEEELAGTGISLMRMQEKGVPAIEEYIGEHIKQGETLGFDGSCVSASFGEKLEQACEERGAHICYEKDLADYVLANSVTPVWPDRPPLPAEPVWEMEEEYAGETCGDKLAEVRKVMEEEKADYFFLSSLDDIMWLFNLRGADIACNPVALSYALIGMDCCILFLQKKAAGELSLERFGVEIREYGALYETLYKILQKPEEKTFSENNLIGETGSVVENAQGGIPQIDAVKKDIRILVSKEALSYKLVKVLSQCGELIFGDNPTELLKAIKNETELSHLRKAYLADSAAVCKFIYWLKKEIGGQERNAEKHGIEERKEAAKHDIGAEKSEITTEKEKKNCEEQETELTEISAAEKLADFRRGIPGFLDLSFPTICGYKENGAIVHYEATEKTNRRLMPEGMVLVDSGGQYRGGTTDITRTIVLGKLSEEEKQMFSYVAAGMLRLADAVFLEGAVGRNLDILARQDLWQKGLDYKHGTGHGVGYVLNVHEGPQRISWQYNKDVKEYALREGMLVSDEPGIYLAGRFGVRTENILEVVKKAETEYGSFLGFRHLTYVPIDRDALDKAYLTKEDVDRINAYHKEVYEKIAPYLEEEEKSWLREATEEL